MPSYFAHPRCRLHIRDCNWHINFSVDQGISFGGMVMQTVNYANTISDPGSFALLTLGAVAAGFVATRGRHS